MKIECSTGARVGLDDECGRIGNRMKSPLSPPSYAKNKNIHVRVYVAKFYVWQARYLFIVSSTQFLLFTGREVI